MKIGFAPATLCLAFVGIQFWIRSSNPKVTRLIAKSPTASEIISIHRTNSLFNPSSDCQGSAFHYIRTIVGKYLATHKLYYQEMRPDTSKSLLGTLIVSYANRTLGDNYIRWWRLGLLPLAALAITEQG